VVDAGAALPRRVLPETARGVILGAAAGASDFFPAAAVELLAAVRSRTRENEESTKVMDAVTKGLQVQAEGLRNEVRRFQI